MRERFFLFRIGLMKSRLLTFFGLFFLCACVAFAGAEKKNYEQALKSGGKDGAVVFVYGPDWEGRGEKLLAELFKNKAVKNACGNAGLVAIPVYQRPNEKQKKEAESAGKGFRATRKVRSYPALILKGADGNDYYTVCGDEILQKPEKVAELMKEKFELYKKQREILKKAEKAQGLALAKIYAEACNVEGIYDPPGADKIIRTHDPNLKEDVCARALFDIFKLITDRTHPGEKNDTSNIYSNDAVIARMKELTAGDRYTPQQKQEIYMAATGLLRRNNYDAKTLRKYWAEMVALDPDSIYAKYALNSAEIYTGEPLPKIKKQESAASAGTKKTGK